MGSADFRFFGRRATARDIRDVDRDPAQLRPEGVCRRRSERYVLAVPQAGLSHVVGSAGRARFARPGRRWRPARRTGVLCV